MKKKYFNCRKMLKIRCIDRVTNKETLEKISEGKLL